ncbi:hypothetical protein ACFOZ0_22275 [Streptomyces yaanensis]|uniref:Uncharacterized protein n=1 Tax=Streptomyces yaanensis TaxID=1142239 RepID=A0ABV7SI61_9ACTN|nr:hypothetical protein [Streptomyces sp. CGMCC 4.7035]WNB97447.1 hypothetical protein Q2K21_04815 [Streptomyces sp. CGMCC 4.7035]
MTWNEPEDQIPAGSGSVWHEPTGGDTRVKGCSDLLEDFLKKITEMESEYLRALDTTA